MFYLPLCLLFVYQLLTIMASTTWKFCSRLLSYPIFWPPVFFYSASKVVLPGYFLKFLRDISSVFLAFYMYIFLSVRFANISLVFSQTSIRLNLIFYLFILQRFTAIFLFLLTFVDWEVSSFLTKFRQRGYFEVPHLVPKGQF